jgi:hypothetical protein
LLAHAQDFNDKALDAYYAWVQQMMTIGAGALTLLVTLRDRYAPPPARWLWLLAVCWVGLAASIALCAIILHGRHVAARDMSKAFAQKVIDGDTSLFTGADQRALYRLADSCLPWTLAGSLVALVVFGVANLW